MIRSYEGITLYDFKMSNKEMQELYSNHSILLIPTSDDSFNITVLEAIKSGLPVIGSTLYAIPEMVKDGFNGFLTEPSWQFFDRNNVPNPQVWNNRDKTIYSKQRNERVTQFLYNCILRFIQNRDLLLEFSLNSYKLSTAPPFSREYIVSQWNKVFGEFEK
jgi:glycosyltransferase involved in cell wall biosynthesis